MEHGAGEAREKGSSTHVVAGEAEGRCSSTPVVAVSKMGDKDKDSGFWQLQLLELE
jgi:hypothetical protein